MNVKTEPFILLGSASILPPRALQICLHTARPNPWLVIYREESFFVSVPNGLNSFPIFRLKCHKHLSYPMCYQNILS